MQWSELTPGHADPSAVVPGRGAFAKVYRATYATMDVAVKVLREENEIKAEDFEREVRAAASVVHPNAVRLHGAVTRGSPKALVLELCPGGTLRDELDDTRPSIGREPAGLAVPDAVEVLLQVASLPPCPLRAPELSQSQA